MQEAQATKMQFCSNSRSKQRHIHLRGVGASQSQALSKGQRQHSKNDSPAEAHAPLPERVRRPRQIRGKNGWQLACQRKVGGQLARHWSRPESRTPLLR